MTAKLLSLEKAGEQPFTMAKGFLSLSSFFTLGIVGTIVKTGQEQMWQPWDTVRYSTPGQIGYLRLRQTPHRHRQ